MQSGKHFSKTNELVFNQRSGVFFCLLPSPLLLNCFCCFDFFQAFTGPWFDGDIVVVQNLSSPVRARYVIFNPREPSNIFQNYMCMRIDILSCQNGKLQYLINYCPFTSHFSIKKKKKKPPYFRKEAIFISLGTQIRLP